MNLCAFPPREARRRPRPGTNCFQSLRLSLFAGAALLLSVVAGCASSPWRRELHEPANAGVAVYLESKYNEADQTMKLGYAHPLTIAADDLAGFLAALRYTKDELFGGRTEDALFTIEEVDRIAPPLARALAAVGKDQRVRFVSMRSTSRYAMFRVFDCTSAVLFATAPGKIHIAFDYVHEGLAEESGDPQEIRLHREPTELLDDEFTIVAPAQILRHSAGGRMYPRWITATPDSVRTVAASTAIESARAAVAASVSASSPAPPVVPTAVPKSAAGLKKGDSVEGSPDTIVADFHGYAIVRVGDRFYGLPKGTSGAADKGVIHGTTAGAVMDAILEAEKAVDP